MKIADQIEAKLITNFNPIYLNIINQSHMHHGHSGDETHFKIEIVSEKFDHITRLERHRLIQNVLSTEIALIKAFSLHPFTKAEWENKNKIFDKSPTCRGTNES